MGKWVYRPTLRERVEHEGGWFPFLLGSFVVYGTYAFWAFSAIVLIIYFPYL